MSESPEVYTLADLGNWAEATRGLEHPARLAVIGDPVAHSRSPQMHNPALRAAGIDASYVRLHLRPEELLEGIAGMKEAGFFGFNVTIPHKSAVFDAVDDMSETARRVGAVNTVAIEGGSLTGHNTDAPGLRRAVREAFSMDLRDLRVMIIGAGGGAGRGAAVQCAMDHCERLVLVNRTVEKARELAAELRDAFHEPDRLEGPADRLVAIPWEERAMEREVHSLKVARVLPSQKDAMASCRSGHSDSGLSLSGRSMARTGETRTSAIMASCEKDVFTFLLSKLNARLWNDAVDPFQQ